MTICVVWTVKGGSGASTLAAGAALAAARGGDTLLVDLVGDQPALLGLADRSATGIAEWCRTRDPREDSLGRLERPVADGLDLLTAGATPVPADESLPAIVAALRDDSRRVVVDAGVVPMGPDAGPEVRSILVVRACYLALHRVVAVTHPPDGVVLVVEPGRALDRRDVERVVGAPVLAAPVAEPVVARRIDAGILVRRPPGSLLAAGRRIW